VSNLNDLFVRNQENIGGEIYKTTLNSSVWLKLVPKEAWPDGVSDVIQAATSERNLPANIDSWSSLATPNSNSNNCVPNADVVPSGQTLRQYNLEQKAIESEDVCVNDTRNAYQTAEQVKNMYSNLKHVVKYIWARRAKVEYARLAEHKMIAANGLPEANALFPKVIPTSVLTQGILNKIYTNLILDSAEADGGSLAMQDGAPQFILVTDMESSDKVRSEDAITNAFLYNNKRVPELLQPMGVNSAFRGFYHLMDNLPRRWNFTGGNWVEVQPYVTVPTSRGTKLVVNPEYVEAPYMDSYVFLPTVFSFMVPKPITSVGSGTEFDAQSYMGDFKWKNIEDRVTNPDKAFGYYRAVLQSGSKPVAPQFGYVIRHLRCPGDIGAQACPAVTDVEDTDLSGSDSYFVS
jgi:hypothetical protein